MRMNGNASMWITIEQALLVLHYQTIAVIEIDGEYITQGKPMEVYESLSEDDANAYVLAIRVVDDKTVAIKGRRRK